MYTINFIKNGKIDSFATRQEIKELIHYLNPKIDIEKTIESLERTACNDLQLSEITCIALYGNTYYFTDQKKYAGANVNEITSEIILR